MDRLNRNMNMTTIAGLYQNLLVTGYIIGKMERL